MSPEEFRLAYFEQYAEDGDECDDDWFVRYFDSATDWLEVEYRAPHEGLVVYSDPESDLGGFWAKTSTDEVEGPFQTMAELAVSLGYSPRNFPPDGESDDDFDDLDDDLDEGPIDDETEDPEFGEDFEGDDDDEDDDEEEDED